MTSSLRPAGSTRRWRAIRLAVLDRDGWTCWRCGVRLTDDDRRAPTHATVGHRHQRRAEGGGDDPANLAAECLRCNTADGASVTNAASPLGASRSW